MFHELNVWEEGDNIIADVAAANGTALFPDETGERKTHGDTQQSLRRWTIDITKTSLKEEVLNDRDIQFPRPDDRMMTRKTQHSFANINLTSRDGRVEGMDAVLRFDSETGKEDYYHFGPGSAAGELVFAPRMGSTDEADGYAMTIVHRANAATSELAIFAAKDIAAGPVATVRIPFRVPSGFHCNYYSADNPLFKAAFQ
jgi:carotenoid cleavage dioxygenase